MRKVSLTGNDVISLGATLASGANLRVLNDLADGDTGLLSHANELATGKVGKNNNVIYAFNSTGKSCTLDLRVLLGSADDKYLNAEMNSYLNDPTAYTLLSGEIVKKVGDGLGNAASVVYKMSGGIINKIPDVKENVEGDTEQAVAIYSVFFANSDRAIS